MLFFGDQNWGPIPFKIFNTWLQDKPLLESIKYGVSKSLGGLNSNVQSLIKQARVLVQEWSRDPQNNLDVKIRESEGAITSLENSHGHDQDIQLLKHNF